MRKVVLVVQEVGLMGREIGHTGKEVGLVDGKWASMPGKQESFRLTFFSTGLETYSLCLPLLRVDRHIFIKVVI